MSTEAKQVLLSCLRTLRNKVSLGEQSAAGICLNAKQCFFREADDKNAAARWLRSEQELRNLFYRWPEFNGNVVTPIDGEYFHDKEHLWGNSEYGKARHRLLAFCIQQLESDLNIPCSCVVCSSQSE